MGFQEKTNLNWHRRFACTLAACSLLGFSSVNAADQTNAAQPVNPVVSHAVATPKPKLAPCTSTEISPATNLTLGKSSLIKLSAPAARLVVGGAPSGYAGKPFNIEPKPGQQPQQETAANETRSGVADVDVILLGPSELYLLGKRVGAMNVILQSQTGRCTIMDIMVTADVGALQAKLAQLMPSEKNIIVSAAEDSLILTGEVSDAMKAERAVILASAYAPEKKVVNMLSITAPQQVMLEVKVAEVSKSLLDRLGARVNLTRTHDGVAYSLLSGFLTRGAGVIEALKIGKAVVDVDGEKQDGLVRILAEPNLMAISGQEASFLSGGKIFIPVAQSNASGFGGTTITLEEKEFGVGIKFKPTVLEGGRINLKVASEVSEVSQTGSPFTTVGGVTAILPSFSTRRADTTVQLNDGQSFAVAGLIKNNVTETIKRFPGLGEVPILGALFRSSEFQQDMTELLFIITPRLVKPLPADYALPTDHFIEPSRSEFLLEGKLEGSGNATSTQSQQKSDAAVEASGDAGSVVK